MSDRFRDLIRQCGRQLTKFCTFSAETSKPSEKTPLLHFANQVCERDLHDLSQQVNDFFKSVSDFLLSLSADNDYRQPEVPSVSAKYVISVEEVEHHLHTLDACKAQGQDLQMCPRRLPVQLLRYTRAHFARGMFHVSGVLRTSVPFQISNHQSKSKQISDQFP